MLIRKKEKTVEIIEGQNNSLQEGKEENIWDGTEEEAGRDQRAVKLGSHSLHRDAE